MDALQQFRDLHGRVGILLHGKEAVDDFNDYLTRSSPLP
jgi:hypothetical protein